MAYMRAMNKLSALSLPVRKPKRRHHSKWGNGVSMVDMGNTSVKNAQRPNLGSLNILFKISLSSCCYK